MPSERDALARRRRALQEELRTLSGAPLMRGSLYQRRRRCGSPSCACATDPAARHAGSFLTVSLAGRTQGFHLRAADAARAAQAIAAYHRLWKIVNALTACEVAELRRHVRERRRERARREP